MTDDVLLEKQIMPAPGSYTATVTAVERVTINTQMEGEKELLRWSFAVETDDGVAEMDALSSLVYGRPRSKNSRWTQALLGKLPDTLSADDLVGAQALAVVDLDAEGYAKVVDLVALPKGAKS